MVFEKILVSFVVTKLVEYTLQDNILAQLLMLGRREGEIVFDNIRPGLFSSELTLGDHSVGQLNDRIRQIDRRFDLVTSAGVAGEKTRGSGTCS